MAIQMRRGSIVDFDPGKLVPGEWAVPYDNNDVIFICTSAGHVVEISSASVTKVYAEAAEAWAVGEKNGVPVDVLDIQYQNNAKYYSNHAATSESNAATSESNAEAWAIGERGGTPVTSGDDTYENNSKYYAEQSGNYWDLVHDAVNLVTPSVSIDFTTGELNYSGSQLLFWVDNATGNLMWNVVTA